MKTFDKPTLARFWKHLGLDRDLPSEFVSQLENALVVYIAEPSRTPTVSTRDRNAAYNKLENAIEKLTAEMIDQAGWLWIEMSEAGMDFEPPDFGNPTVFDLGEYEGLNFSEMKKDKALDALREYSKIVRHARKSDAKPRGRRKQNMLLEETLFRLGRLYTSYTAKPPMKGYRYDESDSVQPYRGPFLDFAYDVLWTVAGRPVPSGSAIGDAARRVFKLRK